MGDRARACRRRRPIRPCPRNARCGRPGPARSPAGPPAAAARSGRSGRKCPPDCRRSIAARPDVFQRLGQIELFAACRTSPPETGPRQLLHVLGGQPGGIGENLRRPASCSPTSPARLCSGDEAWVGSFGVGGEFLGVGQLSGGAGRTAAPGGRLWDRRGRGAGRRPRRRRRARLAGRAAPRAAASTRCTRPCRDGPAATRRWLAWQASISAFRSSWPVMSTQRGRPRPAGPAGRSPSDRIAIIQVRHARALAQRKRRDVRRPVDEAGGPGQQRRHLVVHHVVLGGVGEHQRRAPRGGTGRSPFAALRLVVDDQAVALVEAVIAWPRSARRPASPRRVRRALIAQRVSVMVPQSPGVAVAMCTSQPASARRIRVPAQRNSASSGWAMKARATLRSEVDMVGLLWGRRQELEVRGVRMVGVSRLRLRNAPSWTLHCEAASGSASSPRSCLTSLLLTPNF